MCVSTSPHTQLWNSVCHGLIVMGSKISSGLIFELFALSKHLNNDRLVVYFNLYWEIAFNKQYLCHLVNNIRIMVVHQSSRRGGHFQGMVNASAIEKETQRLCRLSMSRHLEEEERARRIENEAFWRLQDRIARSKNVRKVIRLANQEQSRRVTEERTRAAEVEDERYAETSFCVCMCVCMCVYVCVFVCVCVSLPHPVQQHAIFMICLVLGLCLDSW